MQALFAAVGEEGVANLSIDGLRHRCGLSRGVFYRHFESLEAMLVMAAGAVGSIINAENSARYDAEPDPARRLSLYCRYFVMRAASGRACTQLLLHTMPLTVAVSQASRDHATRDFVEAVQHDQFDLSDIDVAVEVGHSMQLAMMRRALDEGYEPDRLSAAVEIMLRGFGLDRERAHLFAFAPMVPVATTDLCELAANAVLDI